MKTLNTICTVIIWTCALIFTYCFFYINLTEVDPTNASQVRYYAAVDDLSIKTMFYVLVPILIKAIIKWK